ncbi:hypothetical protein VNO77_27158 [Canavalia gladiata]|uniref:Uncharacterized protein n=1 Tax=Canavalia gladiata TaxID=3824 RepID=A0AAN9Q6V8_CANGL
MLAISTYPITSKYALRGFYMDRYVIRRAVHFTYVGQSYAIVGSLLPLGILQFESSWIEPNLPNRTHHLSVFICLFGLRSIESRPIIPLSFGKDFSNGIHRLEDDWASLFIMQNRSLSHSSDQVQINAASRSGQGRFPLFNGRFPWSVRPESESSQEDMV